MIVDLGDSVISQTEISDLKKLLEEDKSDKTFADVFVRVSNHAGDIGHDLDDEVNPFPFDIYKQWEDFLCDELLDELKKRTAALGIEENYYKIHHVGHAFVNLFGYVDGSGWWCTDEYYEAYNSEEDTKHHFLEIEPGFLDLYRVDGVLQVFDPETLAIEITTSEGKETELRIIVPGLIQWWESYVENCNFSDGIINQSFDMKAFHEKGLELAQEIRKQLPNNFTLYYKAPYEDHSGIIKDKVLIEL